MAAEVLLRDDVAVLDQALTANGRALLQRTANSQTIGETARSECMPNFELVPGEYAKLPDFLVRSVPGFSKSPEFALVADCFDLPGVIVGALRSFLERLDTASREDDFDASSAASLEAVYRVIEAMASSDDPEVENAVVVEIFEHLQEDQWIRENLHPRSRALYERWIV